LSYYLTKSRSKSSAKAWSSPARHECVVAYDQGMVHIQCAGPVPHQGSSRKRPSAGAFGEVLPEGMPFYSVNKECQKELQN